MCPHCRQSAPIVYRGVVPYCTACGGLRIPLTGKSMNFAGKPSQLGGAVARTFGWLILTIGLMLALGMGAMAASIWTVATGLFVGLPLGIVSLVVGLMLLRGGKTLHKTGTDAERDTHEEAIYALAAHRGGVLRVRDVSQALGIREDAADLLLTNLAKQQSDRVTLDLDEQGGIYFRFPSAPWSADSRFRVDEAPPQVARPRVVEPEARGKEIDVDLVDEIAPARRRQAH